MIRLVKDDLRPPGEPPKRHLLSVADLTRDDVDRLLGTAQTFAASLERHVKKLPTLKGHLVVNLFYESSTRTSSSFELAAKRLSADTLSVKSTGSSVDKGESLKDTALTLGAYDPDVIVIRHPQIGAPQLVANVTDASGAGREPRPGRSTASAGPARCGTSRSQHDAPKPPPCTRTTGVVTRSRSGTGTAVGRRGGPRRRCRGGARRATR